MASSLPATFKQAVFTSAGSPLTIQEAPLVPPGPDEVLVKVEACGVCHSDLVVQHNALGVGFPMTPGHEVIGRVAAVGKDAEKKWKVGDRIGAGWHGGYDGTCGACKKGLFQMCDNQPITGVTRNGGYAEYVLVRSEAGVRVPADVDAAKYAPLLCAGVTVFNSMRQMGVPPGSTVAVQGLGGLGHLGVQYAAKFGYRVVALSRGRDKEAFARQLGAHEYVDTTEGGDVGAQLKALGGADLIVVTAPDAKGIPELLGGLAPLGKLLVLSVPSEPVPINIATLLFKGLSVHSWPTGHAVDMEETIQFSELQGVDCMIEKFPLEKANEAYDAMLKGSVRFRAVLTFE